MGGIILPGMGYSSDTGTYASTVCYNYSSMHKGNQQSYVNFDSVTDYLSLKKEFDTENTVNGVYQIYNTSTQINYLKSIKEDSYTISVSYYQKISNTVYFTYPSSPELILNDVGKKIYNDGKNNNFRIICGDYLIANYEEGAGIIVTILINFQNTSDKKKFEFSSDIKFSSFGSLIPKLKKESERLDVKTRIRITGMQYGGNPVELSKIISSNNSSCDYNRLEECNSVINKINSYITTDFPNQFSKGKNGLWENLFLNTGKIQKLYTLSDIGLMLSKTFITTELENARMLITKYYLALKYYVNELLRINKFFTDSKFDWKALILKADKEISILNTAEDMFLAPNRGMEVYRKVKKSSNANEVIGEIEEILASIRYEVVYDDDAQTTVYYRGNNCYGCYFRNSNIGRVDCKAETYGIYTAKTPFIYDFKAHSYIFTKKTFDDDMNENKVWIGLLEVTYLVPFLFRYIDIRGIYLKGRYFVPKYEYEFQN